MGESRTATPVEGRESLAGRAGAPPTRYFEQWSKLPREVRDAVRRSEDYLVAHTLGVLRYLPAATLTQLLALLGLSPSEDAVAVDLWPTFDIEPPALVAAGFTVTEPDAYLHARGFSCLVEAKYVGSQLGSFLGQLGREWLLSRAIADDASSTGATLLLVTLDTERPIVPPLDVTRPDLVALEGAPRVSIERQIVQFVTWARRFEPALRVPDERDVADGIRWISWSRLGEACRSLLRDRSRVTEPSVERIVNDVLAVLSRFNADPFRAWRLGGPSLPAGNVVLWPEAAGVAATSRRWPALRDIGSLPAVVGGVELFEPSGERLWRLESAPRVDPRTFTAPWGES